MSTMTSRWKLLSSLTVSANLLCVACGSDLAVHGRVEGAQRDGQRREQPLVVEPLQSLDGTLEIDVVWGHNRNFEYADFVSTPVDDYGDFRLELGESPPAAHLIDLGDGVRGASASIDLSRDGVQYASAQQSLVFVSGDILIPGSDLGELTAGYHLVQENETGERTVIPLSSRITIDVNSPDNCVLRLYPELNMCEEQALSEQDGDVSEAALDACLEAHTARAARCFADG